MAEAGVGPADLDRDHAGSGMRRVLDKTLQATAQLMIEARSLPSGLKSRRLAMESGAIIAIADRLVAQLRRRDPLAGRVQLTKAGFLWCCLLGVLAGAAGRAPG